MDLFELEQFIKPILQEFNSPVFIVPTNGKFHNYIMGIIFKYQSIRQGEFDDMNKIQFGGISVSIEQTHDYNSKFLEYGFVTEKDIDKRNYGYLVKAIEIKSTKEIAYMINMGRINDPQRKLPEYIKQLEG